jgi:hypothetical protein
MNNEDVFKILDKDCTQLLDDKNEYAYLRKKAKKNTTSYYEGEMVGLNKQSPDEVPIVSFHGLDVNAVGLSNNVVDNKHHDEVRIVLDINNQYYHVVETNQQIQSSKKKRDGKGGRLFATYSSGEEEEEEEEDEEEQED